MKRERKWRVGVLLASLLFLGLAVYVQTEQESVTVFAAASTTNAITEVGDLFSSKGMGKVVPSFASSSTLAKQIENGAPADVFISADEEWMDYLTERKLIVPGSRLNLLGNRLVLIAPASSSTVQVEISPRFPLAKLLGDGRLAMGDPDHVPAGKYAQKALESLGVWGDVQGRLARVDDVRAALVFVEKGEAPLGIVYSTDAAISNKVKVLGTFPAGTHPEIVYPAGLVTGKDTATGRAFLGFLRTQEARAVFEKHGFVMP